MDNTFSNKNLYCFRCGSRENLDIYVHKKSFKYKSGGGPTYLIKTVTKSVNLPVCLDCKIKIKKWEKISSIIYCTFFLAIIGFFAFTGINYFMNLGFSYIFFVILWTLLITILIIIYVPLILSKNNPKRYIKMSDSGIIKLKHQNY